MEEISYIEYLKISILKKLQSMSFICKVFKELFGIDFSDKYRKYWIKQFYGTDSSLKYLWVYHECSNCHRTIVEDYCPYCGHESKAWRI